MTEQKHTPLPWKVSRGNAHVIVTDNGNFNETIIAETREDVDSDFIVKACNSYYTTRRDTLLEVAEKFSIKYATDVTPDTYGDGYRDALDWVSKELERMAEQER